MKYQLFIYKYRSTIYCNLSGRVLGITDQRSRQKVQNEPACKLINVEPRGNFDYGDNNNGAQVDRGKSREPMKTRLSIKTPAAGTVHVLPDYLGIKGIIAVQYFGEATIAQRNAAAHYLFAEGFIQFAEGKIELECPLIGQSGEDHRERNTG